MSHRCLKMPYLTPYNSRWVWCHLSLKPLDSLCPRFTWSARDSLEAPGWCNGFAAKPPYKYQSIRCHTEKLRWEPSFPFLVSVRFVSGLTSRLSEYKSMKSENRDTSLTNKDQSAKVTKAITCNNGLPFELSRSTRTKIQVTQTPRFLLGRGCI